MLNKYDYEKLIHDLKRASRCLKLIAVETDEEKRRVITELLSNELDRLHSDLEEIKKSQNGDSIA